MKKVLVVSNYRAGRKTAILNKKKVMKFLFDNAESFKIVDISEIENINIDEFDTIIAMGGDGTVNKVLPYVINSDKKLGIIPCGTANLLAAKLGISTNINKALKILKQNVIKQIDVLSVNDEPCILRFGLGFDSDIIGKTPQSVKNKFGYFSYFIAGIIFALRLKNKKYEFVCDGQNCSIDASCMIIANAGNMFKNAFSVANKCILNDGLFDIFILKTQNPIIFFIEFIMIMFNFRKNNSRAEYIKANKLVIKNKYCLAHIDGEKTKITEDISFNVLNKSVQVYCKSNKGN